MPVRFEQFYNLDEDYKPKLYLNPLLNIELNEADKQKFLVRTDTERVRKARVEVRTRPPQIVPSSTEGYDRLEYNFKAFPSTEFKRHWGYADVKDEDVKELFCDCKDFFYRLYAPMVNAGLATRTLAPKYQKRLVTQHNGEWTKETNPDGTLFVCKHLYALLAEYVNDKEPPAEIIEKNKQKYQLDDIEKEKEAEDDVKQRQQDRELMDMKAKQKKDKDKSAGTHIGTDDQDMVDADQDVVDDENETEEDEE